MKPDRPNGLIHGYTVDCQSTNMQPCSSENVSCSGVYPCQYTLSPLHPYTNYTVTVFAFNVDRKGNRLDGGNSTLKEETLAGKPTVPQNVVAVSENSTTVQVSWTAPSEPNGPIDAYTVEYNMVGDPSSGGSRNESCDGATECSVTLSSLWPYSNYSVTVFAFNTDRDGRYHPGDRFPTQVQTLVGSPTKPQHVTAVSDSSTSIVVKWQAPKHPNGPRQGYEVQHCPTVSPSPCDSQAVECDDGAACNYVISGLRPYTHYNVTVFAYNVDQKGIHLYSDGFDVQEETLAGEPGNPRNVTTQPVSSSSINVSWLPPADPNGPISRYEVDRCRTEPPSMCSSFNVTCTGDMACSHLLSDLWPYTEYTVTVTAVNVDRNDQNIKGNSSEVQETTLVDSPSEPKILNAESHSPTSISVNWTAPTVPRGPIDGYRVLVCDTRSSPCSSNVTVPCDRDTTCRHIVSDLDPYTNYTVTLFAYNTDKHDNRLEGNSSTASERTLMSAPSSPQSLTAESNSSSSILVQWTPPDTANGPIHGYNVRYCEDGIPSSCDSDNVTCDSDSTCQSYFISQLPPYTNYTVEVSAFNIDRHRKYLKGESSSTWEQTMVDVPSLPRNVTAEPENSTSIIVTWVAPENPNGPIEGYKVQHCLLEDGVNCSCDDVTCGDAPPCQHTLLLLQPFSNYTLTVFAFNVDRKGNRLESNGSETWQQTLVGKPGTPENFVPEVISSKSILLHWSRPANPNGPINGYFLSYWAVDIPKDNISADLTCMLAKCRATINELNPFTEYRIKITAYNFDDQHNQLFSKNSATVTEKTQVDAPSEPRNVTGVDHNATAIALVWNPPVTYNGPLDGYVVMWSETNNYDWKKKQDIQESRFIANGLNPYTNYTFRVVAFNKLGDNLPIEGKPSQEETIQTLVSCPERPAEVTVNATSQSTVRVDWSSPDVPNGPIDGYTLQWYKTDGGRNFTKVCQNFTGNDVKTYLVAGLSPSTNYTIELLAYNVDDSNRKLEGVPIVEFVMTLQEIKGPGSSGGLAAGLSVLFILLVSCAVGGAYFMRKNNLWPFARKPKERPAVQQEERKASALVISNMTLIRPIKKGDFETIVRRKLCDSALKFSQEFEELQAVSPVHPCEEAQREENRTKNRWVNILPFDHARVKLLPMDDEPGSDYINASYIPGNRSLREYIATQGPVTSTVDDFWRMIWEQEVSTIVMLTKCVERGKPKCEQYWPARNESAFYGDLKVHLVSESSLCGYTIRIFDVQLGKRQRTVKQMHFTHFPDFGCPDDLEMFVNYVRAVRDHLPHDGPGPIVVHCSAGVGRTGTYIAVDRLIQYARNHEEIDVFQCVLEMRQQRKQMVQTENQYIYIHECLLHVLQEDRKNKEFPEESIYANVCNTKTSCL